MVAGRADEPKVACPGGLGNSSRQLVQKIARMGQKSTMPPMKRVTSLVLLVCLSLSVVVPFAMAATVGAPVPAKKDSSPAAPLATAISTVTGIAISPLLGTSGYGAFKWFTAKDEQARAALPWYAQIKFWLPALLLVAACAAKDTLGTVVPPGLKKPLDVLETLENKFSGLVAAGAVVPFAMDTLTSAFFSGKVGAVMPELAHSGLATIQIGAFDGSGMLNLLTVPFGVAIFALVWLASHAINVLILLSPWGAIDAALKGARTALLGLITLTATMDPMISAGLSLVVIIIAYFVAGWAFRLTCFGSVFCWEFVSGRKARFTPAADGNTMFAGAKCPGVPIRSFGRLMKNAQGGFDFVYRPWLVFAPRTALVPGNAKFLAVGSGAFFSEVIDGQDGTVFTLPPRYRGHEEALVGACGFSGVRPIGLHKAWSQLRALFGGNAAGIS